VVLLGGEAGLRCGEMMALEWTDVDLRTGQVSVERSEWKGHVTATKGGRVRHIPLTNRLQEALQLYRDVRGQRVLVGRRGQPLTQKMVQGLVKRSARRAGVPHGVHILRHTTTQRYMHLSPTVLERSIRLLDQPRNVPTLGDMLETGEVEKTN